MFKYDQANINTIEAITRAAINEGATPYEAIVGVFNALAGADVLFENGFGVDELDFGLMMTHLSEAAAFAKKINRD
jgi:hypothetical protein